METPPKPKKPLKDVHSGDRSQFIKTSVLFFKWGIFILPLFIKSFGWIGLIYWGLSCLSLTILVDWVTDAIGTTAGRLYTGKKANWSLREKLEGDLSAARVQKMKGHHEKALTMIEAILAKDPSYADALFVKAQILFDSYRENTEAMACLRQVMTLTPKDEPLHRWAVTLKTTIQDQT